MDGDHALLWTDTEIYLDSVAPAGFVPKLAVNPLAAAAGAGCGPLAISQAASAALLAAASFDDAIEPVRDALRRATVKHADAFDGLSHQRARYLMAGFSAAAGRMVIWDFDLARFYAPAVVHAETDPPLADLPEIWRPRHCGEVVDAAARQMIELRKAGLRAGERGALTVAEIAPSAVTAHAFQDFMRRTSAPVALAEGAHGNAEIMAADDRRPALALVKS